MYPTVIRNNTLNIEKRMLPVLLATLRLCDELSLREASLDDFKLSDLSFI